MTLIEMVIAMGILSVVMLPLADVFYAGQSTDTQNRQYGDAVALGDAALAKAEAVTYSSLGFYAGQFAPYNCSATVPGYNGQTAVTLQTSQATCQPPSGTAAVTPVDTSLQVGGVHFTLTTYVVWAKGSGTCTSVTDPVTGQPTTSCPEAEKQVYAVVTWNGRHGHTMTAVQNVLVYPGGLGPYNGPGQENAVGVAQTPPNVTGLSATSSGVSDPTTQVMLSWDDPGSPEPGWYEVVAQNGSSQPAAGTSGTDQSWDPSGASVMASVQSSATSPSPNTYQLGGLAPGTTYHFVVVAFSSDGSMWAVSTNAVSATTTGVVTPPACTLTSLTIKQTGQTLSNTMVVKNGNGASSGHLLQPVNITVGYSGSCSGSDTVVVSATGAATLGPYSLTYQSSSGQYAYSPPTGLCPANAFVTGQYTFTVKLDGAAQTPTANVAVNSGNGAAQC